MSTLTDDRPSTPSAPDDQSNDGVEATVGVVAIAVGVVAIAMPLLVGALVSVWLGVLLVVLGVVRMEALKSRSSVDVRLLASEALRATGYVIVGIVLVVFPLEPTRLSYLLAIPLLLDGVGRLVGVIRGTTDTRSVLLGVGLVSLAALLVVPWPGTAAWVLGLLFGLGLILVGVSAISRLWRRSSSTAG
ncbi:Uncharacterized membrane protein HdeD, DUF308 family [Halogranum amylolyticum]|uniref:Uncharacterized membrane protein HdeD, DUF308 family n=1 Tax=Halogranum amylolyticum TaxID=660520 RepID=A0A1H8USI3_9EURY|nr:DUF308 domain-containing protein [Halogranum amylolyticum]SEP06149.1 Uncharacterized membrane protein HdeD, DUF308 family [Halogranum amylolyticum]